jgi:hypothetical protein
MRTFGLPGEPAKTAGVGCTTLSDARCGTLGHSEAAHVKFSGCDMTRVKRAGALSDHGKSIVAVFESMGSSRD